MCEDMIGKRFGDPFDNLLIVQLLVLFLSFLEFVLFVLWAWLVLVGLISCVMLRIIADAGRFGPVYKARIFEGN